MSSPAPVPPSKDPWEDEDFRFSTNGTACEWGEAYHPGGYHPVHLGDVIQDRYRIIRKLGWGQFSTVWLAVDNQLDRYVSLKITVASQSQDVSKEATLYQSHLQPGSEYLVALYDVIKITGPNGEHDGLLFETMGPNLTRLLQTWPEFQIGEPWERRFTKGFAKKALLDTIRAFPASENVLQQPASDGQPLERLDGKKDFWAPSYLLEPLPLGDHFSYDLDPLVKLTDLGGAFADAQPIVGSSAVTPVALRAPETILGDRLGKAIDIWCFGCLVFEMLLGRSLFVNVQSLEGKPYDEISNDEHLIQLWEVLGPLPKPLLAKWRRADQYFGPGGERLEAEPHEVEYGSEDENMGGSRDGWDLDLKLDDDLAEAPLTGSSGDKDRDRGINLDHDLGKEPLARSSRDQDRDPDLELGNDLVAERVASLSDSISLAYPGNFLSLEEQFRREKPGDIDEVEGKEILNLLHWIFQYDPAQRPSAKDIIGHPWFSS